jgi:hypothetical protein
MAALAVDERPRRRRQGAGKLKALTH